MTLPLERFRMLDLTRLVPGPMATWMLADLGMDVVKIEDVADRSAYRDQQAARASRDKLSVDLQALEGEARSNAWDHTHRNKRSIAINLQKPEGQAIFHRLVADADVFFGSFRLGVYKRLGADYETLSKINHRLIYATLSGYGFGNSFTEWPGNERNAQGMSGVSALTTGQDGEPADMLFQPVDSYSAALAVIAIQAALFAREQTGSGQLVDIALVEGGTAFVNANVPDYFRKKSVRKRGFPSIGNLKCKDGKYLSSAASAQAHFWAPFCDAVGLPEMRDRMPGGDEASIRKVKQHMLTKTRDEWLALIPKEIAVVAMLEFDEVLEGPFAKERGMVLELDHPLEGTVRQLSSPFRLSDTPPTFRHFAPCWASIPVKSSMALATATARLASLSRRTLSAPVTGTCPLRSPSSLSNLARRSMFNGRDRCFGIALFLIAPRALRFAPANSARCRS
jgi:crotonobetainyl-CoA:carnitine CoA-transferase CaiB-like acyl-CoA transferase